MYMYMFRHNMQLQHQAVVCVLFVENSWLIQKASFVKHNFVTKRPEILGIALAQALRQTFVVGLSGRRSFVHCVGRD